MSFITKIKNKIKRFFRKPFILKIPQYYAKDLQQYCEGGCFSTSYEAICAVIALNSSKTPLFYLTSKFWNLKGVIPQRFEQQKAFIESTFLPKLKKSDCLLDMGCANGEWTFMFAPFVKEIVAYDYSAALISGAKEIAKKDFPHICNITFNQGDISTMSFDRTYDCISFMGVLSCILEWDKCEAIIAKLYTTLRGGGVYDI